MADEPAFRLLVICGGCSGRADALDCEPCGGTGNVEMEAEASVASDREERP